VIPAPSPAPAEILSALNRALARGLAIRLDLRWYPTVPSTMDVAAEAALASAPEGLVIVADEQTAGRGRRGRPWSSPAGAGLYLTFVLRPPPHTASGGLSLLTLATGVAVREAVMRATGFAAELKWPNDVVIERRKLAGILAEGISIGTPDQTVLIGVGVNVRTASHPGEIADRATSLEAELGRVVDRGILLEELLVSIPQMYDRLRRGNADDILRAWRSASPSAVGRVVEWQGGDGVHRGTTTGIDESGALLVRTGAGTERVLGGELIWI
jgi:BirA family biotin operon repressor/biotin-[acetyl-CoA-carboxylase] ligase